jgi:hypothetical protein
MELGSGAICCGEHSLVWMIRKRDRVLFSSELYIYLVSIWNRYSLWCIAHEVSRYFEFDSVRFVSSLLWGRAAKQLVE